jgi:hypothetical protein
MNTLRLFHRQQLLATTQSSHPRPIDRRLEILYPFLLVLQIGLHLFEVTRPFFLFLLAQPHCAKQLSEYELNANSQVSCRGDLRSQ